VILVTGGAGFVGRHLLRRLAAGDEPVRCLMRRRPLPTGLPPTWEVVHGELGDPAALAEYLAGVRTVIHLSASPRAGGEDFARRIGEGTRCLLEVCRAARVHRLVALSVLGARDTPDAPYLRALWEAERAIRESGVPYLILQAGPIFGEGDSTVAALQTLARRLPVLPIPGGGSGSLQPIWVGDVVSCILRGLEGEDWIFRTHPAGGPEHHSLEGLAGLVLRALRLRRPILRLPLPWMRRLVARLERWQPGGPWAVGSLEVLSAETITAPDAVQKAFGFAPMPVGEGLTYLVRSRTRTVGVGGRGARSGAAPKGRN
jgi:NADH dehydrogenase